MEFQLGCIQEEGKTIIGLFRPDNGFMIPCEISSIGSVNETAW